MKILLYPKGYDPMVASGPPDEDVEERHWWTPKDTKRMREVKKQATVVEVDKPPDNRWYNELDEEGKVK